MNPAMTHHRLLSRLTLLAALTAVATPGQADSQAVASLASSPLTAQAHLDFRIIVRPSLALRLNGHSARITSTQDAPLQWQGGIPGVQDTLRPAARRSLDRVVTLEPAAGPQQARVATLAAP
jgi:hypothetical protein